MSPRRSSSLGALTLVALAAGCARGGGTAAPVASASPTPGPSAIASILASGGRVGFVEMPLLVRAHPLYPQLAHLDEDVQALELTSAPAGLANAGDEILRAEHELQGELDRAAAQTRVALASDQREYSARERAAIAAALASSHAATGPSGKSIANSLAREAQVQSAAAADAGSKNFQAYRGQLVDQDRRAVMALQHALAERATREYAARVEATQRKEADAALALATRHAAERLSLRTQLSNLALDDVARADTRAKLDALDRSEADAMAKIRNRDQATLAEQRRVLRAGIDRELAVEVAKIRRRTVASIDARDVAASRTLGRSLGPLPGAGGTPLPPDVSPELRARLAKLHATYQHDFDTDAAREIGRFQKTRAHLTARFKSLAAGDAKSRRDAQQAIAKLQNQRADLYASMVDQIDREVGALARKRGIDVVVSGVLAPASAVDLTAVAKPEIESLHE